MNPVALLGVFIAWPWLALLVSGAFAALYLKVRRGVVLAAAISWLAYFPYEQAMKWRILCSGECNIRVDLLLFYPVLALLSGMAVVAAFRAGR